MKRQYTGFIIIATVLLSVGFIVAFDLCQYYTLDYLNGRHAFYKQYCVQNRILTLFIYFSLYLLLTALSIPDLSVVILGGGALFGFPITLLVISFADVFGSTLAFLGSRKLFGGYLQERCPSRLRAVNRGIDRDGALYLLYLRLIPVFPCFLINLLMGLTTIRVTTFYWGTQLGKLPHNALYTNAGNQIGNPDSFAAIFTPEVIAFFP